MRSRFVNEVPRVIKLPLPRVPWQVTGNHWLALPCIHPADGAIHAVGTVHRAARAAVEFAGSADFMDGSGPPLLRPVIAIDGKQRELGAGRMVWERAFGWLPTFTTKLADLTVRGTIFAPYGRDADIAGAVYLLALENRAARSLSVDVSIEGVLGHRQQRVRSPRTFDDAHRVTEGPDEVVLLDGAALPAYAALAIGSDAAARIEITAQQAPSWRITRTVQVPARGVTELAFYLGAGPERDGAEAVVSVLRRRGWRDLLRATCAALQSFEQTTGNEALDRVVNRNLLFAYFYAVARALDDAHFYFVRTRIPWNSHGLTVTDWEALTWTLPAIQLADVELARELILRMCELHGYAPGSGVHYLDGTLFEPGFTLEGTAAYALAVDRYISETGDDHIVGEPVIAETLYQSWDDLESRRDGHVPLYATEVTLSGSPAALPYTVHANAVAAQALDVFKRTLDEKEAERVEDGEAVRAALRQSFATRDDATATLNTAVDLAGAVATDDDPVSSVFWLPFYGAISRDDAVYKGTVLPLESAPHPHLATQCARLLGPRSREVLEWIRRAPLDNGFAAEFVDQDGRAVANGGDAALAGLLAYTVSNAVRAAGTKW